MSQSGSYETGALFDVETLTGDSGGAVSPSAGNIDILGADGVVTLGAPGSNSITISQTADAYSITTVQTTDGTANVALFTLTLNASEAVTIHSTIAGSIDDFSGMLGGTVHGAARRAAAGGAVLVASPLAEFSEDITGDPTIDIIVSGNDVIVAVTGVVATTINWRSQVHFVLQTV